METDLGSSTSSEVVNGAVLHRQMMASLLSSSWFWVAASLVVLINFTARYVFRIYGDKNIKREEERNHETAEVKEGEEEDEKPSLSFKFQYQIPPKHESSQESTAAVVQEEVPPPTSASIHNYRFVSEKDFSCFIREPETMAVCVQESCVDEHDEKNELEEGLKAGFLSEKDFGQSGEEPNTEFSSKSPNNNAFEPVNELDESESMLSEEEEMFLGKRKSISESSFDKEVIGRPRFLSEEFSSFGSDSESSFSDGYSVKDLTVASDSDCFLSEREFGWYGHELDTTEASMYLTRYKVQLMKDIQQLQEARPKLHCDSDAESTNCKIQFTNTNNQHTSLKDYLDRGWSESGSSKAQSDKHNSIEGYESDEPQSLESRSSRFEPTDSSDDDEFYSATKNASSTNNSKDSDEKLGSCIDSLSTPANGTEQAEAAQENDVEKPKNDDAKDLPDEDEDELESLWEHQELIEQLKMELKKVRTIGLPTILEESESPKTIEDLRPWKIDERLLREDPMDELHKFYKSYRERMRKFDILNYQKMYAIGFLQLKDPLQSMGSQKPLIPAITSILSQNLMRCRRKPSDDPSERFVRELRCDLETVYVGQMCLSWEFLRWQYEMARELPESDPYRAQHYNQVAGEFQQFQVLVQRFVENEPFQGPRLPNYVKNQCVLRNLLQVPIIKEDCLRERREEQRKGNYAITSEELEDVMEESIRIFWEFVKADKDETPVLLKGLLAAQVDLQVPSDYKYMMHIHNILQKKEKKLKDLLRTGNCLVKKFKKPKEDRSNQDLFFSQVDMKLVSRVLKMPRITSDQLLWCHRKLEKIKFIERKIRREPSFLLFPC